MSSQGEKYCKALLAFETLGSEMMAPLLTHVNRNVLLISHRSDHCLIKRELRLVENSGNSRQDGIIF